MTLVHRKVYSIKFCKKMCSILFRFSKYIIYVRGYMQFWKAKKVSHSMQIIMNIKHKKKQENITMS